MTAPTARQPLVRQTIGVSWGAREFTYPLTITETDGQSIATDPVFVRLGDSDGTPPGATLYTPDLVTHPAANIVVVKLFVTVDTVPLGDYRVWVQIGDGAEVVPRITPLRLWVA